MSIQVPQLTTNRVFSMVVGEFYGTMVVKGEESRAIVNENEILIPLLDISRIGLGDEGISNLEMKPVDPKWLWTKIYKKKGLKMP